MKMLRRCKICGKEFTAIKSTQFFCSRKRFKKAFYQKTKEHIQEMRNKGPVYPSKECSFCLKTSKLNFDPVDKPKLFDSWGCPYCGATNKLVWENQDKPNSYQIISQILVTIHSTTIIQQPCQKVYMTYHLPVNRLDQGNPSFLIMACDKLDIFDIQRKNRKKISFS